MVKKKIKEYGKKNEKDTGLEFLEYSSESSSSDEENKGAREPSRVPDPQLNTEYQLPQFLFNSYSDVNRDFRRLDDKVLPVLSSLTRIRYETVRDSTIAFLMRGSLHQMEVEQARRGQIET